MFVKEREETRTTAGPLRENEVLASTMLENRKKRTIRLQKR
jgi:hypothetical protein